MIKFKKDSINYIFAFLILYFVAVALMCLGMPQNASTILFYFTIIFLSLIFAALAENANYNRNSHNMVFALVCAFTFIFIIFAFRNKSAIDDYHYYLMFEKIRKLGALGYFKQSLVEPAYILLLDIVARFTDDYIVVQIVTAIIPCIFIIAGMYRMKDNINIFCAFFILISEYYFLMLSTNLSRMFISISIIFFAAPYLFNYQTKKYIFWVIIATLFHAASAFMLIFYFLAKRQSKSTKKIQTFLLYLSIPLIFIAVAKFIAPYFGTRHAMYTEIRTFDFSEIVECLDKLPVILVLWLFKNKLNLSNSSSKYIDVSFTIYSFSLMLDISSIIVSLGRLTYFTEAFYIISMSSIFKNSKSKTQKLLVICFMVIYGMLSIYITQFSMTTHADALFPYENIFFSIGG